MKKARVRAATAAKGEASPPRFLDLCRFYITASLVGVDEKALTVSRLARPDLIANFKQYLTPLGEKTAYKNVYHRLQVAFRSETPSEEQISAAGDALTLLFDKLEQKDKAELRSIFTTAEEMAAAKKLAKVFESKDPLPLIASIRLKGLRTKTQAWVRQALKEVGVNLTEEDDLIEDVATATILGKKAGVLTERLGVTPDEDTTKKRQDIAAQVEKLAEASSNPEQVRAAAVLGAASAIGRGPLKTKTGARLLKGNVQQEEAMLLRGKSLIASGAGSGKTRVLASKIIYHIEEEGVPATSTLAASFTQKSGAELIDRIKKFSTQPDILGREAMDGFGTTHSIAYKIMKRFLPEQRKKTIIGAKNGKPPGDFTPDELAKIALAQVGIYPSVSVAPPDHNETFFPNPPGEIGSPSNRPPPSSEPIYNSKYTTWPDTVFAALDWLRTPAAAALRTLPRPWKPKAGWDAVERSIGVFETIVQNKLDYDALTFAQRQRVDEVLSTSGIGFKGVSGSVLSAAAKKRAYSVYSQPPKFGDEEVRIQPANQWFNLGAADEENNRDMAQAYGNLKVNDVLSAITKWKGQLITPGMAYHSAGGGLREQLIAAAYGCYEWLKKNDPLYLPAEDGDDHLINFSRNMIENGDFRAQVQNRFKYVIVDEAQDLNPAQHLMFGLISGSYDPATRQLRADGKMTADTYTMIGDDKQAIYAFRGAEPNTFIDNSDARGGTFKTKFLSTNYRSGRIIVNRANKLIANNRRQIPMTCEVPPDRSDGAVRFVNNLSSMGQAGMQIAEMAREAVENGTESWSDFGVGVRTSSEGNAIVMSLLIQGIPFKSKFNPLKNPLLKGVLHWFRLAITDEKDLSAMNQLILECSQQPRSNINKSTLEAALTAKAKGNYLAFLTGGGWSSVYADSSRGKKFVLPFVENIKKVRSQKPEDSKALIDFIINDVKNANGKSIADIANIREDSEDEDDDDEKKKEDEGSPISPIYTVASRFPDPKDFIAYIKKLEVTKIPSDDAIDEATPNRTNAVTVGTVHSWKGLEIKHMFVPMGGLSFPSDRADIEDERRLAYVAITRGEESVTVLSVPQKSPQTSTIVTSPFLAELGCGDEEDKSVSGSAHDDAWDSLPWHKVIAGWSEMQVDRALTKLNQVLAGASRPRGKALRGAKFPPNPFSAIDLGFDFVEDDDYEPPPESVTQKTLRALERGDVVKIGSTSWAIQMRVDNFTVWAYKWPSKKTKSYQIQLDLTEDGQDVVKVRQITGSAQPIGPVLASGTISPSSVKKKAAGF